MDAVYQKKIEADVIDDAQGNERQNACEFLYDYMLNSYGLKGLAESAIHGVFRRIKQMMIKGIDKFHKVKTWLCNFLLFACDIVRDPMYGASPPECCEVRNFMSFEICGLPASGSGICRRNPATSIREHFHLLHG